MEEQNLKNSNFKESNLKDNLEGLKLSLKYVKTIFGEVNENIVTFCFDTSGSMYRFFPHFREQLAEVLFQMMFSNRSQRFNVVLFNSGCHQCFNKHVKCSQENIMNVLHWMNKPYFESKSNMLGGLLKSFEDDPDAVYLVTDGFPSEDHHQLFSHLSYISKGRPIRIIMITNKIPPEDCALDFLEDMAEITNGSLSVISLCDRGAVEVIMPIHVEARPAGIRRSIFSSFLTKRNDLSVAQTHFVGIKDRLSTMYSEKTLNGDPMEDLPLVAPFISEDPLSGKKCPFYHPFYHWYWPQFWQKSDTGPCCLWTKNNKQYHCMSASFRESRAFISGRKYLETYQNPKHILPYASLMVINKKVLACNHNDSNNYYIGRVISQETSIYFCIQFDVNKEFNEVQKTSLNEIIDYEDQKRHSINVNDYVLAPLNTDKEAFSLGIVVNGNENRILTKSLVPRKDTKLTVKFISNDLVKDIEPNIAILLTFHLKQVVERNLNRLEKNETYTLSQDEENYDDYTLTNNYDEHYSFQNNGTNNNNINNNNNIQKSKETFCGCNNFHPCCGYKDKLHRCINGRVASPVDDCKAMTLDEINEQIKNKSKNEEDEDEIKCKSSYDSEKEDEKEEITKYQKTETCKSDFDSDDEIIYDKNHITDEFTETDLNWCILRLLNKHSKNKSKKDERPPWRYWGHQNIPDVIDPPTSEPYNNPPFWGCLMPKQVGDSNVEWTSTTFQEVNPHRVTNTSPQKMYELFKHQMHNPSRRPKRDACVGRNILPPEEITKKLLERRFHYIQGGYPRIDLKNPYTDSVKPILTSYSVMGAARNQKGLLNCLNSLEKTRIESQIQRDESNILRYVETIPAIKR